MFRKPLLLLSFALFVSTASADTIQLTVTGSVNSTNLAAISFGQQVTVTLDYDSTAVTQSIQSNQGFFLDAITSFSVDVGGYHSSYSGMFGQIDQMNNLGNSDGLQFEVAANPATYQYGSAHGVSLDPLTSGGLPRAFDYAFLNLASSSSALWSAYGLPTTYTLSEFDTTHNLSFQFSSGGFSAGLTSLTVTNLSTAPEPGTWILAGVSLIGLAGWRRKRARG
jgi:hypothetical protein